MLGGKLGLPTRVSWTFCSVPENVKNACWDAFVLFYYAQVLGLDGSLIALALGLILVCDALIDPYVGSFSDNLRRAPLGRRHTLMAAAILPFGLGFAGVFSPPPGLGQWALFSWLLGFGLLARVGISFYTVPAFAVGVELSRDPAERPLIVALRNIGAQVGMLLVPVIAFRVFFRATPEYPRGQLNPEPYASFGLTMAGIAMVAMLVAVLGTQRRIRAFEALETGPREAGPDSSLGVLVRELRDAFRVTPNVRRILALSFLVFLINSTIASLTLYLATYFWQFGPGDTERLLVAGTIGSFLGLVSARWPMQWFEKKSLMVATILGYFGCALLGIALPLLGVAPAAGTAGLALLVVGLRFLGGVCYGWYLVGAGTVTLDVSDEHEVNTGRPQQGLVMSFVFLGLQAASAVAGVLAGVFLDILDLPRGVPLEQMPQDKISALAMFVCAIIVAGGSLLAAVIRRFDVSKERQALLTRRLEALKTGGAAAPVA
jgi:GPH family glycoside/pentoside/hexuronide:cation symporter